MVDEDSNPSVKIPVITQIHRFTCHLVFESRFSFFLLFGFVITVLINGVWIFPSVDYFLRIARFPFINSLVELPGAQFFLDNYLLPLLAYILGAGDSLFEYIFMCSLMFMGGMIAFLHVLHHKFIDPISRSVLVIFALGPISLISLGWLGYVDFLTIFFCFILAFFWNRLWLLLIAGVLMGLNHYLQGIAIAIISFFGHSSLNQELTLYNLKRVTSALLGVGIGYAVLRLYFSVFEIHQSFDRFDYILVNGLDSYIHSLNKSFGLLVYSLFGVLWIFVIYWFYSSTKKPRIFMGIGFIFALGIMVVNQDQTRVFSLLTFPLLLIMIRDLASRDQNSAHGAELKSLISWIILAAIFLPKIIIWNGEPFGSLISFNIEIAKNVLLGYEELQFENISWLLRAFSQ